ncbi:coenzyme F420 hydrogenase subunit beta [Methanosarcina mazei]|jgi:coenzyme F420 hydrogenase subunit beta|uniref:Coenzyme F420 hydrogenase subunit beta n=7 Tax=Methanosarcina mazei TaxID=2209 RepID=A0A0F8SGA9_METMZ|nr:coenzyme F420 hydrogenase subunit beta [Methanosarcina mazei]AKB40579.1 Coenzyme F420 hydrogenase subunit beta [Methanosarcina mazei WWM610]AKB61560.1 Coenzyme F420 hydrogenase subunit beta [Methanosarcina mazei SarPi]AKB64844.1 Coenzyme F420 hydrogenase subunit beta [Methanosarcina mazei S-6]AKB68078.1 Coenzyme F420 hydrogenase subunit beta [Methanosarcina mazei LYC]AKB72889.1 Coenzyme F420 hydrogenase subunit beta [Methanosarcina mazei C16]
MIEDPYLGKYTACVSARSTDREILKKSQDGGIATTLMVYALEQGIIDGAIVTGKGDRPWEPKPFVAMSREDILKARGTIYNISPQISWLKEATRSYGLDRVGVTGVCCQMQAVRKAQLYPMNMRDVPEKIGLAIGLFCMENFSYKSMQTIVEDHAAQSLGSVKKMEITKGKFWVYTDRGNVATVPLKDTHKYEQPGCHVCLDYVSNLGDISTGSVGSPEGWSTVFIRTRKGNEVWSRAVDEGLFETKPIEDVKPGLDLLRKLAKEKIDKNRKTLEERRNFGVNKALRDPYA